MAAQFCFMKIFVLLLIMHIPAIFMLEFYFTRCRVKQIEADCLMENVFHVC